MPHVQGTPRGAPAPPYMFPMTSRPTSTSFVGMQPYGSTVYYTPNKSSNPYYPSPQSLLLHYQRPPNGPQTPSYHSIGGLPSFYQAFLSPHTAPPSQDPHSSS
ncbi:hypothetical protein E1B28_006835 [Marasmius oreades]|uniref:Uncharacterized protein n=1 Tax=Marasmius oreades TaxID=181124 RepID=A0A9P8AAU2_9AGAR|nr:uncharacterized protein E1B28_006835 [Marasmius oreades]KAG7096162.1 hypothetical protein E1B28_006835 [Marasmius oreades]